VTPAVVNISVQGKVREDNPSKRILSLRRKKGKFISKQVSVDRSLAADRRSKSKTVAKKGEATRRSKAPDVKRKKR
jgi:hypothetical protein